MRNSLSLPLGALGAGVLFLALTANDPIDASTVLRLDVPGLVERADAVVEGRVASSRVTEAEDGRIETEYVLEVARTLLGEPRSERVLRFPGGLLEDGRGLILPGLPHLVPGEEVLLFLSAPSSSGLSIPVGLSQGKFRILTGVDGTRLLVRDPGPLTVANLATGELREAGSRSSRDYAEVMAEIHAAIEHRRAAGAGGEPR